MGQHVPLRSRSIWSFDWRFRQSSPADGIAAGGIKISSRHIGVTLSAISRGIVGHTPASVPCSDFGNWSIMRSLTFHRSHRSGDSEDLFWRRFQKSVVGELARWGFGDYKSPNGLARQHGTSHWLRPWACPLLKSELRILGKMEIMEILCRKVLLTDLGHRSDTNFLNPLRWDFESWSFLSKTTLPTVCLLFVSF